MKTLSVFALLAALVASYLIINKNNQSLISKEQKQDVTIQSSRSQKKSAEIAVGKGETLLLFDIEEHGANEIKKLLQRAEFLSQQTNATNKDTEIVMVIHGPDMDIFDKKNYPQNKDIVDLAARLDATSVIDFKICQTVANIRGISDGAFPSFMEMVPFAPDELDNLEQQGYVNF